MPKFRKEDRLRSPGDFKPRLRMPLLRSNQWLIVYGCPNALEHARLGVSVSRKIGNAVDAIASSGCSGRRFGWAGPTCRAGST